MNMSAGRLAGKVATSTGQSIYCDAGGYMVG